MSLYKGNNLISGAMPNSANQSLSNLDSAGQDKFDAKVDLDLTNVNDTGYIKMAGAGMPSNRYIELTLGASGTTYTAPADGWFCSRQNYISGYYDISIGNINLAATTASSIQLSFLVPARKGQVLLYNYSNLTTGLGYTNFRFIYAQGSESEAS